jgi:hypothetical protein
MTHGSAIADHAITTWFVNGTRTQNQIWAVVAAQASRPVIRLTYLLSHTDSQTRYAATNRTESSFMPIESFDAIVIGAGQAGPALAARCSKEGLRTVRIERHHFGGTCVNVRCVPTKALVASARPIRQAQRGAEFGFDIGTLSVDMARGASPTASPATRASSTPRSGASASTKPGPAPAVERCCVRRCRCNAWAEREKPARRKVS